MRVRGYEAFSDTTLVATAGESSEEEPPEEEPPEEEPPADPVALTSGVAVTGLSGENEEDLYFYRSRRCYRDRAWNGSSCYTDRMS